MKTDKYGVKYSNDGKILYEFPNDLEGEYIIPDGVKEIKKYALDCKPFNRYPKLSSLRISKTVVKIGHSSGYKWLDSISIDKDNPVYDSREDCKAIIETKSNTLLYGCKHAFVPNGVQKINMLAFDNTYAESRLFIPASVEEIDAMSFWLTSVDYIEVDVANKFYDSRDNCNAIIDSRSNTLVLGSSHAFIPSGVESIGQGAFECCGDIQKLVIPESVYCIEAGSFKNSVIEELYISKSVEQIESSAFEGCVIRKIYVDENNSTFYEQGNCLVTRDTARIRIAGKDFTIPSGVKIIGSCSLTLCEDGVLIIPDGVVEIMSKAIAVEGVRLKLVLPSSVKVIMKQFLSEGEVEEVVVPKGQKKRFSRMAGLANLSHLIVEADE